MKKIIVLLLVFSCLLSLLGATQTTVSIKSQRDSLAATFRLESKGTVFAASYSDSKISSPPFFSMIIDDKIHLGEIRDSGVFSLMLSPFSETSVLDGFTSSKRIINVGNPAIKPKLSGVTFTSENLNVLCLSPIFNPASPKGFGLLAGTDNFFGGFLTASQNEVRLEDARDEWQIDWNTVGIGKAMLFSIVGANASSNIGSLGLKSSIFVQSAWDLNLGGGTTYAANVELKTDGNTLNYQIKRGGQGIQIKELGQQENPLQIITVKYGVKKSSDLHVLVKYNVESFPKPVYGGTSQIHLIGLETTVENRYWEYKAKYYTDYESNKGKASSSVFSLKYEGDLKDLKILASCESKMTRMKDFEDKFETPSLSFETDKMSLAWKNGKTLMSVHYNFNYRDALVKLSLNQDGMLTATLSYSS